MENSSRRSGWIADFSAVIDADRDIELALDRAHGTIGFSQYRPPFTAKLYVNAKKLGLSPEETEFIRHAHNIRNARVHDNSGITVSEEFLLQYEALARRLNPKSSAYEVLTRAQAGGTVSGVLAAQPTDQLRTVLIQMATGDFSQVPAYDGEKLLGLLTAEHLLMYIASSLKSDPDPIVLIDLSIKVADVVGAITPCPRFSVETSPAAILEAFRESEIGGNPLTAVIITQHGRADEKPLAIISAADLPLLA
jgi:predicted transcriptional regulator